MSPTKSPLIYILLTVTAACSQEGTTMTPADAAKHILYHGVDVPPVRRIHLRAGPLSMIFEPELGYLRYIRLHRTEVLRGIYAAVRDRTWGTVPSKVSNLHVQQTDNTFRVRFDVTSGDDEIDFQWRGTITGGEDGTVTFAMDGEARSTFVTQRTGFCVLHPIAECAGRPCTIEGPDGTTEESVFPYHIAPRQPFTNIRAIRHEVAPSIMAQVRFDGVPFETEDQRNWTDTSYKTYCLPPAARRSPYKLAKGDKVRQTVTLCLQGAVPPTAPAGEADPSQVTLRIDAEEFHPPPKIGLCYPLSGVRHSDAQIARLKGLNLAHLRVDVDLQKADWSATLQNAAADAEALGVALELALTVSDAAEAELDAFAENTERLKKSGRLKANVARVLVFFKDKARTDRRYIELARKAMDEAGLDTAIGTGVKNSFCELNRRHPEPDWIDVVCWAASPQHHAFDDETIIENLAAQGWTVESARQFMAQTPIAVGPVTLRPGGAHDPRQASLLGAAWTLGSIKYLAQAGADSVTYHRTTGPGGVMGPRDASGPPTAVYPVYHVLADIGELVGGQLRKTHSSDPLVADGICITRPEATDVLLANFTPRSISVHLPDLTGPALLRILDETNASAAMGEPGKWRKWRKHPGEQLDRSDGPITLELRPFAVARIRYLRRFMSD